MLQRAVLRRASAERGMYFPFAGRVVDTRESAQSHDECAVHARPRRHLRSAFVTGETRQTAAPAWSARRRPTHFLSLALPARNALVTRVKAMHEQMLFADPHAAALLVPLPRLHVTLGVMTLDGEGDGDNGEPRAHNDDDAAAAATSTTTQAVHDDAHDDDSDAACVHALRACVQAACRDVCTQPLQLRFRGLGTFAHGRVLFARCMAERHYTTLDTLVRRIRREAGGGLRIDMKGNPHDSYVPHITLAKVRPQQVATHGDCVPRALWTPYQHYDFGDVTFARLDLCRMRGHAGSRDGYYPVVFSLDVVSGDVVRVDDDNDVSGGVVQHAMTRTAVA